MEFDTIAYAQGICTRAAGSSIETFVDTIDSTMAMLDRAKEFWDGMISGLPEHAREEETYKIEVEEVGRVQDRWSELRNAIVQIEKDNDEDTSFGLTREDMQEQIEALGVDEVWEHPENGMQVGLGYGSPPEGWYVMDDGDRYNFDKIEDVLDEVDQ